MQIMQCKRKPKTKLRKKLTRWANIVIKALMKKDMAFFKQLSFRDGARSENLRGQAEMRG